MSNKKFRTLKKTKFSFFLSLWMIITPLYAEVEQITITWDAFICQSDCVSLIEQNLRSVRQVTSLQVNGAAGKAVMGWSPNYPFSYDSLRLAASGVGIFFDTVHITVRGTISHDTDNFYLVSNGDDARFLLIGDLIREENRYVPPYNLATHPLPPETIEIFKQAEKNHFPVVISGFLFRPEHYPRTLIASQIKVLKE